MQMSARDPYPFPTLQNDDNFYGARSTQKQPYTVPTHLAQAQDPWNRLNSKCTLASSRREVYHHDPQAPRDSLDFILKAKYDHHKEFLQGNNETLVQPETLGEEHGRILKNRVIEVAPEPKPLNHPLSVAEIAKKDSIHSKNAIGPHRRSIQIYRKNYRSKVIHDNSAVHILPTYSKSGGMDWEEADIRVTIHRQPTEDILESLMVDSLQLKCGHIYF